MANVPAEMHALPRLLQSLAGYVDYVVISNTSTEGFAVSYIEELRGQLRANFSGPLGIYHHPWQNFGHNRTVALNCAQDVTTHQGVEHFLIADADMTVNFSPGYGNELANCVGKYQGMVSYTDDGHKQAMLLGRGGWGYVGVTHEFVPSADATEKVEHRNISGITLTHHADGGCRADKFERDYKLLTDELTKDPNNARNWFYLGRTLRDLGRNEEALVALRKRVDLGGWDEEVFYAMYMIAKVTNDPRDYEKAWAFRPSRLEPLYWWAKVLTSEGRYQFAYALLFYAMALNADYGQSEDVLWVEKDVYDWRIYDEYAVCLHRIGKHNEALIAYRALLADAMVPTDQHARIEANLRLLPGQS